MAEILEPWYVNEEAETAIVAETVVLRLVERSDDIEPREPDAHEAALN